MILPFAFALAAATQAEPIADPAEAEYRACIADARTAPEAAIAAANAWLGRGGGVEARQCLALALTETGRFEEAAAAFQQAAAAAPGDPRAADLHVQAANAWLAAGEAGRALQAIDAALLTPHLSDALRGEAHLDRARALVALDRAAEARADIDRALALVAEDPFAWYLSAALADRGGDPTRARADIAEALARAPDDPDVLLLAGTIAGKAGDMAEAERLYRRVAALAPESPAGLAARAALPAGPEPEGPPTPRDGR